MSYKNNDRGPNMMRKYVWVIDTILRHRKISFNDLNEEWRSCEMSGGEDLPKRTFDNWRAAIGDIFQIDIENEQCGEYRYYISNESELKTDNRRSWLYNTFCVSNALANSQSIKDRILLEYVPSGQDYLQPIISAMKENRVLCITYQSYWNDEENDFKVQPYCVKLFKQRWYLVAKPDFEGKKLYIFSLDRILKLQALDETFKMPLGWDAKDYFKESFGIFVDTRLKPQVVKLRVSAGQANYIRDLRLHESQEEIERNDVYSVFRYYLRPHYDFIQELLWNGGDVEVLEPKELREQVAKIVEKMWNKYQEI